MKKTKNRKKLPKVGTIEIMFGIPFRFTGTCWVNEYKPKANGLRKENN